MRVDQAMEDDSRSDIRQLEVKKSVNIRCNPQGYLEHGFDNLIQKLRHASGS